MVTNDHKQDTNNEREATQQEELNSLSSTLISFEDEEEQNQQMAHFQKNEIATVANVAEQQLQQQQQKHVGDEIRPQRQSRALSSTSVIEKELESQQDVHTEANVNKTEAIEYAQKQEHEKETTFLQQQMETSPSTIEPLQEREEKQQKVSSDEEENIITIKEQEQQEQQDQQNQQVHLQPQNKKEKTQQQLGGSTIIDATITLLTSSDNAVTSNPSSELLGCDDAPTPVPTPTSIPAPTIMAGTTTTPETCEVLSNTESMMSRASTTSTDSPALSLSEISNVDRPRTRTQSGLSIPSISSTPATPRSRPLSHSGATGSQLRSSNTSVSAPSSPRRNGGSRNMGGNKLSSKSCGNFDKKGNSKTSFSNCGISRSFKKANGKIVYGLDAEIAQRMEDKRDFEFEKRVLVWLAEALNRGAQSESPLFPWLEAELTLEEENLSNFSGVDILILSGSNRKLSPAENSEEKIEGSHKEKTKDEKDNKEIQNVEEEIEEPKKENKEISNTDKGKDEEKAKNERLEEEEKLQGTKNYKKEQMEKAKKEEITQEESFGRGHEKVKRKEVCGIITQHERENAVEVEIKKEREVQDEEEEEEEEERQKQLLLSAHEVLKSGVILIQFLNKTKLCQKELVWNYQDHDLAHVENIRLYLNTLVIFNIPSECMFNPEDLLRAADFGSFINSLAAFARFLDPQEIDGIPRFDTRPRSISASSKVKHYEVNTDIGFKAEGSVSLDQIVNHKSFTQRNGKVVSGLSAELAQKNESKRDKKSERKILTWVNYHINEQITSENILDKLGDGYLFGELLKKLAKIKELDYKFNTFKNTLAYRQNIQNYFLGCEKYFGLPKEDFFDTQDPETGIASTVIDHLMLLALTVQLRKDYKGPKFKRQKRQTSISVFNDEVVDNDKNDDEIDTEEQMEFINNQSFFVRFMSICC